MRRFVYLIILTFSYFACTKTKNSNESSNSDSVLIGKWGPPNKIFADVTIYKKQERYFCKYIFFDKTDDTHELMPTQLATGTKFVYKNNEMAGEYLLIDKDNNLRWFSADDRQFAKTEPL